MELTIAAHYVDSDPASGFSPLQQTLLHDPRPVRIASAPTGAGKSYAFQKAVAQDNARILFIVPTRRLAQNLAQTTRLELVREQGWEASLAERKVAIWTSDQAARQRASGVHEITVQRLRELYELSPRAGGEIIYAVPEVVSYLLIGRWLMKGQGAEGIFELLTHFDHIVFDEFHTIDSRGFGLAAACARLAAAAKAGQVPGGATVTFLSATPLDIAPVLVKVGVAEADIAPMQERLAPTGRAVHGDVALSLHRSETLAQLVGEHLDELIQEFQAQPKRQVVLIYNSLADLIRQLPLLQRHLRAAGIAPGRTLLVNSIHDSQRGKDFSDFFVAGQGHDPLDFDVLIATASVEMGVTFRSNLLFMEPGFEPLNFLQRYGRAARGDHRGRVRVRLDDAMGRRNPWLRRLRRWVEKHEGGRVDIADLTQVLARDAETRFQPLEKNEGSLSFGSLGNRAAYTAGLYWQALLQHPSNKGPRKEHLMACQPPTGKTIFALLQQVRELSGDPYFGGPAEAWCSGFQQAAQTLRDIGQRLRVRDERGRTVSVDLHWLRRETDLLDTYPLVVGEDGDEELFIEGRLEEALREDRRYIPKTRRVCFPHTPQTIGLEDNGFLPEQWCRELRDHRDAPWDDFPKALEAAEKLVRYTGLVVTADDEDLSLESSSGVF